MTIQVTFRSPLRPETIRVTRSGSGAQIPTDCQYPALHCWRALLCMAAREV